MKNNFIPDDLYVKILQSVPIATVDFVVVRGKGKSREFLLGKRNNKPYKGNWYIPGGRIKLGESIEQAAQRQLKRELGLNSPKTRFICHYSFVHPPGEHGIKYHSLYHVFLVEIADPGQVHKDGENASLAWFKAINKTWPPPVRDILKIAGFN